MCVCVEWKLCDDGGGGGKCTHIFIMYCMKGKYYHIINFNKGVRSSQHINVYYTVYTNWFG